eukprot:PhM_4_TR16983/c0_g1_i1/m.41070/K01610/E4.1.1.49, pckA; phosphoenolpyruvate carboxykinase (ATP)
MSIKPEKRTVDPSLQHVYNDGIRHGMKLIRNAPAADLYEYEIRSNPLARITSTGALAVYSGAKTGRSPTDKRVCRDPEHEGNIWWGNVNMPIEQENFQHCQGRAIDYLNQQEHLFVTDCFTGWDPKYR